MHVKGESPLSGLHCTSAVGSQSHVFATRLACPETHPSVCQETLLVQYLASALGDWVSIVRACMVQFHACRLSDAEAAKLGMRRGRSAYNAEPIQWDAGIPLERRVRGKSCNSDSLHGTLSLM